MILTGSTAARVGASVVRAVASSTAALRHFLVYTDMTLSIALSGAIGLVKNGAGTLTLSGSNSYSGNTAVNSGVLSITDLSALPGYNINGRFSVESGATLAVYNAVTDANVTTLLGTTNFKANSALGFDTTSGDRTYSPVLANTAQGALGLTKLGTGTLTISGANTYTGPTLVIAGTLVTSTSNRIPNASAVTIRAGATLILGGSDTIGAISGAGTFTCGASALALNCQSVATFSGTLTNTSNIFTKAGPATQTLSGNVTMGGTVQITAGLLVSSGTFTQTAAASPRNFQLAIGSTQTALLTVAGGTLTATGFFLGDNGGGTSTVNCNAGTLTVNGQTWMAGVSSTLNIAGGAFVGQSYDIGGGSGTTMSTVNLTSGSMTLTGTFRWGIGGAGATSVFNLDGGTFSSSNFTRSNGTNTFNFNGGIFTIAANLTISESAITFAVKPGGAQFLVPASLQLTFASVLADASSGGGGLVKTGAGTLVLSRTNTYTGSTTISAGTLQIGDGSGFGYMPNSSGIINNATLSFVKNNTLTQGSHFPVISGSGVVVQGGTGTTSLSLANSYTGETRINSGILTLANASGFGTGDIKFGGGTMQYGAGITADVSARIKGNSSAVQIDTNGQSVLFSALGSTNTGGLVKTGTGTLTLTGASNAFTGSAGSNGGTLSFAGTFSTASRLFVSDSGTTGVIAISGTLTQTGSFGPRGCQIAVNSANTGTLNVSTGASVSLASGIMLGDNGGGTSTFNQSGGAFTTNGGFWLAGVSSTATVSGGTLTVNGDSIYIGGGSGTTTSTLTISGGSVSCTHRLDFGVGSANATTILNLNGGSISTPNLFYRAGTHTINFNGGTLTLTATASIASQIVLVVKSGGAIFNVATNNTQTLAGPLTDGTGGGGLTKQGGGTLVLNGADTFTGATTISAGSLQVAKTVGGITATATYTPTALTVDFANVTPASGATYRFLPGSTATTGLTISLTNAGGKTGTYDYPTSTLTIA